MKFKQISMNFKLKNFCDRYVRSRPGLSKKVYKDKEVAGILMEGEKYEDWMGKDLSTCILSGDPECAIVQGQVTDTLPTFY